MISSKKKLQPASPKNSEMHPRGPPCIHNVAATLAEAEAVGVGVVDAEDVEDGEDAVDTVNTVETVDPETVTKVSALIAKLTAIL
jgi:hypothetical protein